MLCNGCMNRNTMLYNVRRIFKLFHLENCFFIQCSEFSLLLTVTKQNEFQQQSLLSQKEQIFLWLWINRRGGHVYHLQSWDNAMNVLQRRGTINCGPWHIGCNSVLAICRVRFSGYYLSDKTVLQWPLLANPRSSMWNRRHQIKISTNCWLSLADNNLKINSIMLHTLWNCLLRWQICGKYSL